MRGGAVSGVRVFFAAAVFLIAGARSASADAPKLALIVTNKAYPASIGTLENTHRDGERMAAALTALGFAVVHKRDLDKAAMLAEVSDYVVRLEKAGPEAIGFFYYSGHGAANSKYGENYLIPVGAPIVFDSQLPVLGVRLGEIIDSIAATSAKANFLVFDACRNVLISFSDKSAGKGLRPVQERRGIFVAFATDPGRTAADEGVYSEALAEEIQKPGVFATEVFRAVGNRVSALTEFRQSPRVWDGLRENMYLSPAPVTDCDYEAASPFDIERRVRFGRQIHDIDTSKALTACEIAVQVYPQEKRFRFQLGRTLDAAKNFGRAKDLYTELANSGHADAINNLATMYHNGNGIAQDQAEGLRLYRKAADLGSVEAMLNLGKMYFKGEGVAQDKAEAARLYRKAIDLTPIIAVELLGPFSISPEYPMDDEELQQFRQRMREEVDARGYALKIMKQDEDALKKGLPGDWSEHTRKFLQQSLKIEGVYSGPIDGKASVALWEAVQALAAKWKKKLAAKPKKGG